MNDEWWMLIVMGFLRVNRSTQQLRTAEPSPPARWPKRKASVACAPCAGPFVASGEVLHRWSMCCTRRHWFNLQVYYVIMCIDVCRYNIYIEREKRDEERERDRATNTHAVCSCWMYTHRSNVIVHVWCIHKEAMSHYFSACIPMSTNTLEAT